MSGTVLDAIAAAVQFDIGCRGLRTDPIHNLVTGTNGDFQAACKSIALHPAPRVAIVTGFWIADGSPPSAETDGPPGALFLARALAAVAGAASPGSPRGAVTILAEDWCTTALHNGLNTHGLSPDSVKILALPNPEPARRRQPQDYWAWFRDQVDRPTHLIAIERLGPSHTLESVARTSPKDLERFRQSVPAEFHDRYLNSRGRDLSAFTSPAHWLFEQAREQDPAIVTIGIGDGGNEIGMGKLTWDVIRKNIPRGDMIACRVPADNLIVAGISNWGAYALAAGVAWLKRMPLGPELFDPDHECQVIDAMVKAGPLVDGVTGLPTATVDGIDFDRYIEPLKRIGQLVLCHS